MADLRDPGEIKTKPIRTNHPPWVQPPSTILPTKGATFLDVVLYWLVMTAWGILLGLLLAEVARVS